LADAIVELRETNLRKKIAEEGYRTFMKCNTDAIGRELRRVVEDLNRGDGKSSLPSLVRAVRRQE
jgi:hypothetical protein